MANHRIKPDADLEFRRGLEELVRGHFDDCITNFSSCSSAVAGAGEDEEDSSASATERRRRRSAIDGDDLAESSAAARRHSRILSRWVARQAEEMITTMERRNRESELMALAGLHTVSMLDPSFLREPRRPRSRSPSNVERRTEARPSRILQMWRELEDMSRERRSTANSGAAGDQIRADDVSESDETSYFDEDLRSSREQSPDVGGDERERERVREIVSRISETTGSRSSNVNRVESPRSEWLGETERERVRLVREWVQMASEQRGGRSSRRTEEEERGQRSRDGSVTSVTDHEEGQPEHVRRDMLRIRGRQARQDLIMRMVRERDSELQGLVEQRTVSEFPHRNRIQALLRGRFLRNGTPVETERTPSAAARELGQLRQRHPVSGLREAFRFRLENIVRGQASSQAETSVSHNISTSRNDQAETSDTVTPASDTHESQPRSETIDIHHQNPEVNATPDVDNNRSTDIEWQETVTQEDNWQEGVQHGGREWLQSTEAGLSDWRDETGEDSDSNWQDNMEHEWSAEMPEDEDGDDNHLPGVPEWHENGSHQTSENWEGPSDPPRVQHSAPSRSFNRFVPPDDDNVYSMELRELLSRRSVSNLLSSGFRESLDHLIQSYVQRQVHAPLDWDLQESLPNPASAEEGLNQQREDTNQEQQDSTIRPPLGMPPPPAPPRQPLWHSELHHSNWSRQSMHRSETEWDVINDLRADMARLQQGMSHMQRMLEACMDMQLELQRSVRQEVSAALNRSPEIQGIFEDFSDDGSKWSQVRKGTCCVCCDTQIDALLYRCGHMCTCSKCANELVRSGGKCPLCRAPIIEVIRAYSIL